MVGHVRPPGEVAPGLVVDAQVDGRAPALAARGCEEVEERGAEEEVGGGGRGRGRVGGLLGRGEGGRVEVGGEEVGLRGFGVRVRVEDEVVEGRLVGGGGAVEADGRGEGVGCGFALLVLLGLVGFAWSGRRGVPKGLA